MSASDRSGARWAGLGFSLLILALGVDFHLDVRERDVLSWMDPYQYYDFASAVLAGRERVTGFEVPSVFPFLLMPAVGLGASIPAALWTNFAATLLLTFCVHALCRELGVRTWTPLVALLVLTSPLLVGLSRSLYVEYTLTAVVALAFLLWLRFVRAPDVRSGALFGVALGLGFMLKMTFPLFFALPVAAVLADRLMAGRAREAAPVLWAVTLPLLVALSIQAAFFPASFGYYLTLGNTTLPIMNLIGPPDRASLDSVLYYPGEIGRTLLFLLSPLLAAAAAAAMWGLRAGGRPDLASPRAMLWLWLVGPMALLVLQPVKEPRHVAPCVVPAVLLVVLWIEGLASHRVRAGLRGVAAALAVVQLGVVTLGRSDWPYFLDRPLEWAAIEAVMARERDPDRYRRSPDSARALHRRFDRNVALADFPANESLALTWKLFPGVVFDLETLARRERLSPDVPFARYEDLYLLAAFNAYNRRTGWRRYYDTLPERAVVDNADFVLVNDERGDGADGLARRFGAHRLVESVPRGAGFVHVLKSRRPANAPYRSLYARAFLGRARGELPDGEAAVVANDQLMAFLLGGHTALAGQVLAAHPELRGGDTSLRNIYWIGGYDTLARLTRDLAAAVRP